MTTTTIAPFREADVIRDTAGKFSNKDQSAPELSLDGDFTLASFMQEPPTVAEPFTLLQPVVYRDVDGTSVHASVVGVENDGFVLIAERTPGTLGDIDDDYRLVQERYLSEDLDISADTYRRQQRGVDAARALAREIATAKQSMRNGLDSYEAALEVRDHLKVDGRTDWAQSQRDSGRAVDAALDDLQRRDLIAPSVLSWTYLEGETGTPEEMDQLNEAVSFSGFPHARSALQAKVLEQYGDLAFIGDGHIERVNASLQDAFSLGERMSDAVLAADGVDADADAIGADAAAKIFPEYVSGLSQRKKNAYRKAIGAASEAFETLERYGLMDSHHHAWGEWSTRPVSEEAILTRAAGQAAILRHYQPETGLTDAQLDAISTVWDGAVDAYSKAAA